MGSFDRKPGGSSLVQRAFESPDPATPGKRTLTEQLTVARPMVDAKIGQSPLAADPSHARTERSDDRTGSPSSHNPARPDESNAPESAGPPRSNEPAGSDASVLKHENPRAAGAWTQAPAVALTAPHGPTDKAAEAGYGGDSATRAPAGTTVLSVAGGAAAAAGPAPAHVAPDAPPAATASAVAPSLRGSYKRQTGSTSSGGRRSQRSSASRTDSHESRRGSGSFHRGSAACGRRCWHAGRRAVRHRPRTVGSSRAARIGRRPCPCRPPSW